MMSTDLPEVRTALTATSYLVLGLLLREGPSTPYELKRHVAATFGHLWSFPHALLYKEPARLASLGLVTEEREDDGRRRRLFTITEAGQRALQAWLDHPTRHPVELRDVALLQLFLTDDESTAAALAIAEDQLMVHRARLTGYEADQRLEEQREGVRGVTRSMEQWRGATLRMGLLYEQASVQFWTEIAADARAKSADPG